MENKKNPKYRLENYNKLFMQLGLVLALFIAYTAVEHKTTFSREFVEFQEPVSMIPFPEDQVIFTKRTETKISKEKKPQLIDDFIDIKLDQEKSIETMVDLIEPDLIDSDFVNTIIEAPIDEGFIEDVFLIDFVENVPVFPGCKGSNQELKNCFNKKIQKHFQRKFNSDLPNELGLSPGKKRVIMIFKIDKIGNIIDIMTKSPHPKLDKEAARIIKLLPKMKPGLQQGKPVGVKYTLPMRIDVD
tara:strand:- start:3523 stop:4254 length:732 start_codon:yes stop_codon:yes gene_type:complete